MNCPCCGRETRIIDSRPNSEGVRRRHRCMECGYRFSTMETIVEKPKVRKD